MKFESSLKIKLVLILILVGGIIIIARLYQIQITKYDFYNDQLTKQLENRATGIYNRGTIFFTEKNGEKISVANLAEGFILSINPSKLKDPKSVYKKLNSILKIDEQDFLSRANKLKDPYEEIATHLPKDIADKIKALNLTGVNMISEKWRYYPTEDLASQTLGFVGFKGHKLAGRYGLERYYEETLKRENKPNFAKFFSEIFSETIGKEGNNQEGNIITAIEPTVQSTLESELKETLNRWSAKSAGGIVMDPQTGEIFAFAKIPNFNPNKYNEVNDISLFRNPLVENVYEMGSIIKPLTVAIGLDTKTIDLNFKYDDYGKLKINDRTIYNYDFKGRGKNVPLQEILNQSLNTGAATIALQIGRKKFINYFKKLGFGEETGIDLPGEIPGLIKNLEKGGDVELATASFGQGIAITPIATIRALSVLANGGVLPNPHIVKKIEYTSGLSKKIIVTKEEMERVIKDKTAKDVTNLLINVVDNALGGGKYKMDRYSIAAKTGTAQIANKDTGGYYKDRYLHSFFGYFPALDPRFIIFLYMEEPQANYASQTLSKPFMEMAKFLINYYKIQPDR